MSETKAAPKVVLGIATRDRASQLPKAIDSALAQDCPNLQIWILNDGSADHTSELSQKYPGVKWTDWRIGQGYIAARNHLMFHSDADYFVSLDDDAWFLRGDEIRAGVSCMEALPKVAAAGFDILSPGNERIRDRVEPQPESIFIGCGHIVRLAAVRQAGGYVTAPGSYGGEEKDLSLRLLDVGHQIISLPGVHVWHDKTPVARNLPEQHRSGVCNDFAMTLRRTPLVVLPVAFLSKLWRHFKFAWANDLLLPFGQGLKLFLKSAPEVWKTRRPVRLATLRRFIKLSRG